MPDPGWIEIPHPSTIDPAGYGEDPYGPFPYGSPSTYVSGLGDPGWTEINEDT